MGLAQYAVTQNDAVKLALQTIEYRYMHPTLVWGYKSGFNSVDRNTGGVRFWTPETPGEQNELTVVGGRSGVGKSSYLMTVALSIAMQFKTSYPGLEVRIALLEMDPTTCMKRLIGQIAGVPIQKLSSGYFSPEERKRVQKAGKVLEDLPITYMKGSHNANMISEFVRKKSNSGRVCGFWGVDHIGLVPTDLANKTGNTSFSLGQVSRILFELAHEVAPGYVLAQLNREAAKKKDPTPTFADLYGSDKMMQDTDNLFLLHRPELYLEKGPSTSEDDEQEEVAMVIIEKQRDGAANKRIPVGFDKKYALWRDLPDEEVPEEDAA